MKPKPRLPAAERRQQLLDTASQCFSRQGYSRTSMNDIAEAAGVTKPVLYQHFGSKRALYLELLQEIGGRMREAIGKSVAEAPGPRQQVERGVLAYFLWVDDHRDDFALLFSAENRQDEEFLDEVHRVERDIANGVAALIVVDGLSPERQGLLAYGVVGLAERLCRQWLREHLDLTADQLAELTAELAWSGLRGLRGSTADTRAAFGH